MMEMSCKDDKGGIMDNGKYVRYTPEQIEALERVYHECPKPSSLRRQQLIRECPILSNIEPKQIKVWFQNRRCREKQRKETSRLQSVNRKLAAMNKLLIEENDRLQKQVSHLVLVGERGSGRPNATGTAIEWVQMPGMKPGPDSIGIVAIAHGCNGVAARACGLVALEPTRVAEILKDRPSWFRDCRAINILNVLPAGNGGTIEIIYMQLYAPTTLAAARDFLLLRYTSVTQDGNLVVCERSLTNIQNGPSIPPVANFVRAEMLPSGYLIRPCEGGGSIIHIVDHMDLEAYSVPEVLRPLYESSTMLAQKTTIMALRQLRQIALEVSQSGAPNNWGRRPAELRALSQRLSRGFNEALNGFTTDGWSLMANDGVDDVAVLVNSSPEKLMGLILPTANDYNIDAYSAAAVKLGPCSLPGGQIGNFGGQVILPLAHTIEHEEVIKMEGVGHCPEDALVPGDMFLLQDGSSPNRTLDLASALDIGGSGTKVSSYGNVASGTARSVMTIAFEFACESHMQETVAALARQYVRTVIASVQKVASALSTNVNSSGALQVPLGTPEAHILARWISRSYR
ncbi:hypothetical protein M8C21_001126 [Ambrosia artemisiifolia]|uniref:Uncharacterized protein n=1 Tax=Ambrosia artemisiifolia TaxID=4212 RepID=A0AAD5BQI9_AMBAR|nr:hypothetical protein M8C21_001126 [Ambrosia artemisiifolia]